MDKVLESQPSVSIPGETGVWVFVFGDMMVFALLFITYLYYRSLDLATFLRSQAALNVPLGLTNTLVLLASSCCVVVAVKAISTDQLDRAKRFLILAIGFGLTFVFIKHIEYGEKFDSGHTLISDDFFMYYFMLTGIHLLHVIVGIGWLLFTVFFSIRHADRKKRLIYTEAAAIYWHMVDLLWLFLFPLLYLIQA